jgi:hypothetical protein
MCGVNMCGVDKTATPRRVTADEHSRGFKPPAAETPGYGRVGASRRRVKMKVFDNFEGFWV